MQAPATLLALLEAGEANAVAITAPERRPMDRGSLVRQSRQVVGQLRGLGVSQQDRVAIVLPNGPEMAVLFLAVAAGAAAAPLNAAYREEEFDFYLSDIEARVLLIQAGLESPARAIAARRNIPVVEVEAITTEPAGSLRLMSEGRPVAVGDASFGGPEDVALVLHTSGTTSRPKIVPLSQRNLITSATCIARGLALTPVDRCLVVMPLFHIHGLIGALLVSMSVGASVYCPSGFNALRFFAWLDESEATWYTAVPTMHQTVLGRAERNRHIVGRRRLRFIRSSSAPLPPPVMRALEETFGCPVIESYGMTEASHQMASNPLPPAVRKPGTVGWRRGPRSRSWDRTARCSAAERSARS